MSTTMEIVPVDTQQLEVGLARLRQEAEAIVVKDQPSYITACQIALDARAYVKDVKGKMSPGINKAKALVDSLRNDLLRWVTPAEQIDGIVSQKAEAWKRAEREAAQREQDEINRKAREEQDRINAKAREEARKNHSKIPEPVAPPPPVYVAPSVPKVAGIKARVNWKFRITDETLVPRLYCTPNEVAIGQMVRSIKDKARTEALIPGIEVYSEDGI